MSRDPIRDYLRDQARRQATARRYYVAGRVLGCLIMIAGAALAVIGIDLFLTVLLSLHP